MLRSLALALLGFSLLAGPAAARGDGAGRRTEAKAATRSAKFDGQAPLLRRAVAVRPAVAGSAACAPARRGAAATRCRGGAAKAASWRWVHGLPPALGVQAQECPADTMATLAEGHEDIVRCIPL